MTAAGEARASENIPGPGRSRRAPFFQAVRLPEESNDPVAVCNPRGLVRLLLRPESFEFVNTPDRLLLLFQWEGTLREFWLDGRDLPSGDNLGNLGPASLRTDRRVDTSQIIEPQQSKPNILRTDEPGPCFRVILCPPPRPTGHKTADIAQCYWQP